MPSNADIAFGGSIPSKAAFSTGGSFGSVAAIALGGSIPSENDADTGAANAEEATRNAAAEMMNFFMVKPFDLDVANVRHNV